jgi:F-type H+-transporting ATPase subunit h
MRRIKPHAKTQKQKFAVPSAPKSPEEADLANELKTYETQQVDVEGGASEGGAEAAEELDWFEPEEEATPAASH